MIASYKEKFDVLVLKVVPVVTKTRTCGAARYWVAVAVGDYKGQIGIGEHVAKSEALAKKAAEKKAFKKVKKITIIEDRTMSRRVTDLSGADCISISSAPARMGIAVSGMTGKLLQLVGIKDCFETNSRDNLTTVRAVAKAVSKLHSTCKQLSFATCRFIRSVCFNSLQARLKL